MQLIDTHTHLYSNQFDEDREEVVQRAIANGVNHFFIPAIDQSYAAAMFALKKDFPKHMHLMMGLHPTSVKANYKDELEFVKQTLDKQEFVAIGEIGMDLYWDKTFIKEQQFAFKQQIQWARERKLPIVIHCRDAFNEVFEVLEEEKGNDLYGIFHCFTGTLEQAKKAISYNMKLGIGGVITFKNGKIDQFLDQIPLEDLVLETDSPYLAPTPYRGKRNESSYINLVAEKLADVHQVNVEKIAEITSKNALAVFGL